MNTPEHICGLQGYQRGREFDKECPACKTQTMADTKLTRKWVEGELEWCEGNARICNDENEFLLKARWNKRAALCRHYLATEQMAAALRVVMREADAAKEPCGSDPESAAAIRNGKFATIAAIAAQGLRLVRGPDLATEQDARDAARYRWLRDGSVHIDVTMRALFTRLGTDSDDLTYGHSEDLRAVDDLDAAIDAALTQKETPK